MRENEWTDGYDEAFRDLCERALKKTKVVLEKLPVPQLGEKTPPHFYRIQKFITVFIKSASDPYTRLD